jgi:L-asparagine oxygenase
MKHALRKPQFITPFDEFSKASNDKQLASEPHAILSGTAEFRFYATRTTFNKIDVNVSAIQSLLELYDCMLKVEKSRYILEPGDLLSLPNLRGLHSRDIVRIEDEKAQLNRWILKTYAFWNLENKNTYSSHFDHRISGLVID